VTQRLAAGEYFGATLARAEIGRLRVVESALPPLRALPAHCHERAYICLVLEGSFVERVAGRDRPCAVRTVKLHPAGETHSERFGSAGARLLRVEVPDGWHETERLFSAAAGPQPHLEPECRRLAHRIRGELELRDEMTPLAVESLVLELLVAANRSPRRSERGTPPWLRRAHEIAAEAPGPIRLEAVARELGVHPGHLATCFRRRYGCTLGEAGRRARIERAALRLERGRESLAEIALAAGFADQSHFSRVFRRIVGCSPARYAAAQPAERRSES
jgi:AraC family transcriptional regulator